MTLPGPGFYAQYGAGNTWNDTETVSRPPTGCSPTTYAAGQTFMGKTGHLVTVRSAAEGTFLYSLIGSKTYWTGLTNNAA